MPDVLYIESCNFEDFPVGGQLSFAKQMIHTYGTRLALVGISTDDTPVGQWVKRTFNNRVYDFFSIGRWRKLTAKPLVPARVRVYYGIKKYRKQILSIGSRIVFISSREVLIASYKWGWSNLCFLCSGLENPMCTSRYKWASYLAGVYNFYLIPALQSANLLLAAADDSAINEFATKTGGRIRKENIISFPTRVDTDIFCPADQTVTREALGIPKNVPVFVTVGRLNWVKGWDLLIEAFQLLLRLRSDANFYFVGEGEDRRKIEIMLQEQGLIEQVHITGFLDSRGVASYLNAADVFVLGSHFEGWPTVVVEALATGKPIISTSVSATAELVDNGKNGYIVDSREAGLFCEAMLRALSLDAHSYSLKKSRPYVLNNLAEDLGRLWAPLRLTKNFQCSLH
jgi:glycosyltransferase involved in cell wall biosynthesis